MLTRTLVSLSVTSILFALVPGCAAEGAAGEVSEEHSDDLLILAQVLPTLSPCDPTMRLPTSARRSFPYVDDKAFNEFEDRLEWGGAQWIGRYTGNGALRAIIQVEYTHPWPTPKATEIHRWHWALVPPTSTSALSAIGQYSSPNPVQARTLGYCYSDNSFEPYRGGPAPWFSYKTLRYQVAAYDPRCVCKAEATAQFQCPAPDPYANAR